MHHGHLNSLISLHSWQEATKYHVFAFQIVKIEGIDTKNIQ